MKNNTNPIEIYHAIRLKAHEGFLTNSLAYFERKVRRWYSKNFSTALQDTFDIPWETILLNYYEAGLEEADHNHVFDITLDMIPEFADQREAEDEEFARELESEQKSTIARKAAKNAEYRAKIQKINDDKSSGLKTTNDDTTDLLGQIGKSRDDIRQASQRIENAKQKIGLKSSSSPKQMNLNFEDEDEIL